VRCPPYDRRTERVLVERWPLRPPVAATTASSRAERHAGSRSASEEIDSIWSLYCGPVLLAAARGARDEILRLTGVTKVRVGAFKVEVKHPLRPYPTVRHLLVRAVRTQRSQDEPARRRHLNWLNAPLLPRQVHSDAQAPQRPPLSTL
jgi:hypothetical protein